MLLISFCLFFSCRQENPSQFLSLKEINQLNQGYRISFGRLYEQRAHHPYNPMDRQKKIRPDLIKKQWEMERLLQQKSDPASYGQLVAFHLFLGRLEKAERLLIDALALAPDQAFLHNNLAVLYLEMSRTNHHPASLKALHHLRKALALEPNHRAASFNMGLVLEALSLHRMAQSSWRSFLEKEPVSGWATEAKKHEMSLNARLGAHTTKQAQALFDRLETFGEAAPSEAWAALARQNEQLVRSLAMDRLLPGWASAMRGRETAKAARFLEAAATIGRILQAGGRDASIWQMVQAIRLGDPRNPQVLQTMAEAFDAYARGLQRFNRHQYAAAVQHLQRASALAADSQLVLAKWIHWKLLQCDYTAGEYQRVIDGVDRLALAEFEAYPELKGLLLWMKALSLSILGEAGRSLTTYRRAGKALARAGKGEHGVFVDILIAENTRDLGRWHEGWQLYTQAFSKLEQVLSHRRRQTIYAIGSDFLRESPWAEEAIFFLDESLRAAETAQDPLFLQDAHYWKAHFWFDQNRLNRAEKQLDQAETFLDRLPDPTRNRQHLIRIDALKAEIFKARQEPSEALAKLTRVIHYYQRAGDLHHLPKAHFARAEALQALEQNEAAQKDITTGLAYYESLRSKIAKKNYRISYFDGIRDLYLRKIALLIQQDRDVETALLVAEQTKARLLRDSLSEQNYREYGLAPMEDLQGANPLLAELSDKLPPKTALINYLRMKNKLFIWLKTKQKFRFFEQTITPQTFNRRIEGFIELIQARGSEPELKSEGQKLFKLLLEPLFQHLDEGIDRLVLIPDGSLHRLPFAALVDSNGRYLVSHFEIGVAPSIWVYLRSLGRREELAQRIRTPEILLAGNAYLDRDRYPFLSPLPYAQAELSTIKEFYPEGSTLRSGKEADKEWLLHNLGRFEIFHFAGHALADSEQPQKSKLLTASVEPSGDDALYAYEILEAFKETPASQLRSRLVILSACSTLGRATSSSEGVLGMAHTFLEIGIPAVIASLWDVPDQATCDLMVKFHEFNQKSKDPQAALAEAQRFLLFSSKRFAHPSDWAAFQLHGGVESSKAPYRARHLGEDR